MLQLGKETKILGGKYTVSRFEIWMLNEFEEWVREQLPKPEDQLPEKYFDMLPPEEQLARVKEAEQIKRDLKCFTLNCDLARRFLNTEKGMAKFSQILLKTHHKDITVDEAFSVMQDAGPELQEAIANSQGAPLPNGQVPEAFREKLPLSLTGKNAI